MIEKRKVAVIGTGGTISSVGRHPFDLIDYDANGKMLGVEEVLALLPEAPAHIEVIPVPFRAMSSTEMYFAEWSELISRCSDLVRYMPDLAGIVITHGTASLEETAYFLNLTLKVSIPVVMVGSQRPSNAMSSDAGLNLYNALRVAAEPAASGLGVLVVLNDEIHAAREVTKTSTYRLQTFSSPDVGVLGHCDADAIAFYRRPMRLGAPQTEFDISKLNGLPKVTISYSYTGADGESISDMVRERAKGIVVAGFAPGCCTDGETEALKAAAASGVVVVMSTRAGSGRVGDGVALRDNGFVAADNVNPQKARLLLSLALTQTKDPRGIARIFETY
jgi:L-asparaginase